MKILIGCEESQAVTLAFRAMGHEAYSCDIQACSGPRPEWHIQGDIFEAIQSERWDFIGLHPPCTALAVSGNAWYGKDKPKYQERIDSLKWTLELWLLATSVCPRVYLENPVGILNSQKPKGFPLPKPQYIQPWQFGHGETKKTGLWLHGLPQLKPTEIVEGREHRIWRMPPSADRGKLRSKTYPGIAKAMAEQWGREAKIFTQLKIQFGLHAA